MFRILRPKRRDGYEDTRLVAVVHEKTLRLRDELANGLPPLTAAEVPIVEAVGIAKEPQLRIVDFGGACGAQYFRTRAAIGDRLISWLVVETNAIVAAARDLEDGVLSFTTELPDSAELVYSSGALQYAPDPTAALRALIDIGASTICLCRLHFGGGERDIQRSRLSDNGPGALPRGMSDGWVTYPRTSLVREVVLRELTKSYRIVTASDDGFVAVSS